MRVVVLLPAITIALTAALSPPALRDAPPRAVVANDNRHAAGTRTGDTVAVNLTVGYARWAPEGATVPAIEVAAISEDGGAPMIPAPLLRVRTGTVLRVRITNALPDSTARVFGLWEHPNAGADTARLAPGASRTFTFRAGAPGTYLYGVSGDFRPERARERDTAIGAFVVDPPGRIPTDRIFVMNIWGEPLDSANYSNALAINGRSWPLTERLEATTGDTLRWRIVNATGRAHPMHLHGFYFTLLSKGTSAADTVFSRADRFDEVTNRMRAYSTLSMEWTPTRPGNWLYHCHIAYHVIPEAAQLNTKPSDHEAHSADANEHMRGLVLGIAVKRKRGDRAERRDQPRHMRLEVTERAPLPDKQRRMQYVLDGGASAATAPWKAGGPLLVLRQGEPTDITVVNGLAQNTAVHWHGIELESYSDGVVGWSGAASKLAPPIAPGGAFTARLSLPRAGTFIYHTHLGDMVQLAAGLYGPIVVLPPGEVFNAERDHVFTGGVSGIDSDATVRVNGDSLAAAPLTMRVGETHRFRFIDIQPANDIVFTLARGDSLAQWMPLAKDGADLPPSKQVVGAARTRIAVGETRDMLFTPSAPGEWIMSAQRPAATLPSWTQRVIVRP